MAQISDIVSSCWRIAICGTESTLGTALIEHLQLAGCEIVSLSEDDFRLPPTDYAAKIEGVKAVINLSGEPYVAKWKGRYEFDIYKSRLEAIRSTGVALRYCKTKPDVFLTISNAMVYDQFEVHDEYSTEYGDSLMSEVGLMETEEAKKIEARTPEVRLVVLRLGYLMSVEGGAYPMLATLAKIGWGGRVDDGYQCLPMVHIEDAIRCIITLISDDNSRGIFNVTIPEMASMNELVKAFAESMSRSQHRLPKFIIKMLAGRAINLLEQNCKVEPRRLNELGFEFRYPSVESIVKDLQKKDN